MLDSKLEPQPGEGSGDNNCSMPRKIPHDEGSGVEVHLSHLQADDPGSGVALANADRERLDNHDDGSRDNNISMALNTMPPDGHLVQAGESGDPCHLKRPGDSKNHVRTTVSKTADCGNDKKQARRTSSPSRHDSLSCTVPAHAAMPPVQDRLSMQNRIVHCLFCTATCTASRLNNMCMHMHMCMHMCM